MASASDPDGLAAGAGALPGARRRCEAGKRTHGPGPRACLALLAATALLALAAPAQAQTEVWSATLTPVDIGSGLLGCLLLRPSAECSSTAILSDADFTHDSTDYTVDALYVDANGSFSFSVDTTITTATNALTLVVGSTSLVLAASTTQTSLTRTWASSGVSLTVGTAINVKLTAATPPVTNAAPTVANAIQDQTATVGTALSYAFPANTFADTDAGDTLTYTATQSDDTALPSWLSFAAATRTFSGTPPAADVGTVSVKVTASDGHGGAVSDTFDIVVSAAAGVTVSKSALTVTEEDTTGDSYTVVLDSQPTANVTVTVAGHAGTDVTPSPTSLTFTTANWNMAQTVTVTAGDDADTANDTVTLTHSAASTDSNYGGITIGSVVVTVADNDSLTAPGAPTGLAATATGPSQIDLAWTAPATTGGSAITGYKIEVSPDGSSWSDLVANTASTDTAYAHVGLDPATTRHYRVSAINANGTGVPSNVDSATTGTTVPGAPTGLTATASGGTTAINLSWSAPATTGGSAITGYKIEVSPNGTSGWTDQVANTNSTATTYAHTGLGAGDTRHYRVSAINANGTGVPSNVDSATTGTTVPGAPTGLTATASGTTAINLSWSAPATTGGSAITGYKIEVSPNGTSGWTDQVANTNSTATTYAHTGLAAGDTRHYRVSAINANGTGVPSNVDSATTASTNTAAMGAPTITGTAQVGQTLTAATTGITDADGLTSPTYTYQWIRVDGTEADIAAANSSTYILVAVDLGTTLKVRVTFADDLGHTETLTSAATATVGAGAVATAPTVTDVAVTSTPASGTTYYLAGEVIEFTVTFSAPVTVTATPKFAFRLGAATRQAAYASGSDSAALVFARTVQAGEVDRNGISWNSLALALDGGTITQTGATTAARLTHAAQASLEGHRVDAAPPMQVSASVRGLALVLVYDEPLDPASMPAPGAYTVTATVGATITNPAVSEVSIYGIWVTLTLDAAPAAGATVTLAYAPPASNPVQDEAGNDAPAFSGQTVNGAAGNTAATGAPTITGTAQVGQTLTAATTGITDADGLTSPTYTYQWIRVDGTDEADIAAANSSTYILVDADLGTTLKVRVTFADDLGHTETLTSAATATVTATPAVPTREPFPEPEPEPEPEPVPALPLLGQLLLALGLAGAGAMRLVRAARRP